MTSNPPITYLPAVSVAIIHDGAFLLVRRGREPSKGLYAFPGGRVDSRRNRTRKRCGASSPRKPASRWRRCSRCWNCICRVGRRPSGIPPAGLPRLSDRAATLLADDDADEVGWFGIEEMQTLPVIPSVLDTAHAIVAASELPSSRSHPERRKFQRRPVPCGRQNHSPQGAMVRVRAFLAMAIVAPLLVGGAVARGKRRGAVRAAADAARRGARLAALSAQSVRRDRQPVARRDGAAARLGKSGSRSGGRASSPASTAATAPSTASTSPAPPRRPRRSAVT